MFCNQAALDLCSNDLSYILSDFESFNQDIYANDIDFSRLSAGANTLSMEQKLLSKYNLRRLIQNRTPSTGAIFIFNSTGSVYHYRYGDDFLGGIVTLPNMQFMKQIQEYWLQAGFQDLMHWQVFQQNGNTLLMNTYQLRNLYICSMLDLSAFADAYAGSGDSIVYAFYTDSEILTNENPVRQRGFTLEDLKSAEGAELQQGLFGSIVQSSYLSNCGIGLSGIISYEGIWSYSRTYITITLAALLVICLLFSIIYSNINHILIYPLDQITLFSRQLAPDSPEIDLPEEEDGPLEYAQIQTALRRLVEQKSHLEKDNQDQTRKKEHALLQYYQLQTRSHFFLNCLKSLYSMSEKGEIEKTKRMITLFSNHLRYIFHDNLSLVPLRTELEEVDDYYQIIQLDQTRPILLNKNVDPGLLDCPVPPLSIQTFLENSYKYNADSDKILRFTIQIDRIELEGGPCLRLRLSDNGVGYSSEILKELEQTDERFEQYHVGINNLKRRMDLIYQKGYKTAFYNAPNGGACSVIYLPIDTVGGTQAL